MDEKLIRELIEMAADSRRYSYAPYSQYRVGAALLAEDGRVFTGCNIENAAYGPSMCAERTAIFKAVSENVRDFEAICVVGGKGDGPSDYSVPCGVCRQVMAEFCDSSFRIIVAKDTEHFNIYTLGELLPKSFGPDNLTSG